MKKPKITKKNKYNGYTKEKFDFLESKISKSEIINNYEILIDLETIKEWSMLKYGIEKELTNFDKIGLRTEMFTYLIATRYKEFKGLRKKLNIRYMGE